TVGPAEREHRGTSVILKLKEDAAEFASPWRLRQIVKRHSDFVAFPIYVGDERANRQTALWRQPPRQVEVEGDAKYDEFYRELTERDPEKYATFWREFGVFLKEGIAADPAARDDLLPLLRFHTTTSGEQLSSLADYKGRMAAGQTEIYYVLAGDLESARRSPHLDPLAERGLEALLLVDMVDAFMLSGLRAYEGAPLRNIDDANLALPGAPGAVEERVSEESFGRLA